MFLHGCMRPLLVMACLLFLAPGVQASPIAPVADTKAGDTLSIYTTDDSVHVCSTAEPWPGDFVRATRSDGTVEFIPFHRVRRIHVGDLDVTDRVFVDRLKVPIVERIEASTRDSVPLSGQDLRSVTITTDDGVTAEFSRVESWPGGFVRAIRANGEEVFLPAVKVQRILDPQGNDATSQVIVNRKPIHEGFAQVAGPKIPRSPALRGRPSPEQRGFTLVQAGYLRRLGPVLEEQDRSVLVMDAGRMRNLSARHSVGASVMLAANNEFTRIGLKPRYRRWISRTVSVDLAPGVFYSVPGDGNPEHAPIGFVGESSLTFGDWVAITAAVHVVRTTRYHYDYGPPPAPSPPVPPVVTVDSGTQATAFLGVKAGGEAAIIGTLASLALIGVMILTYSGS